MFNQLFHSEVKNKAHLYSSQKNLGKHRSQRIWALDNFTCMKNTLRILALMAMPFLTQAQPASRYDVVIDEIMADPSPAHGLPNAEWIEIRNRTTRSLNLNDWKLLKAGSRAIVSRDEWLQPDSVLILAPASAVAQLSVFGRCVALANFPSLGKDGDQLTLVSAEGNIIHSVSYNLRWYHNEVKQEGGWSIEMIDPGNPCGGIDNWGASENDWGGTPGQWNSVNDRRPDESPPLLTRAYVQDSNRIMLLFSEPVSSLPSNPALYEWHELSVTTMLAAEEGPLFNKVILTLQKPLERNQIYHLQVHGLQDCAANELAPTLLPVAIPEKADSFDVVINEILFDPYPGGVDYVELYNRSDKVLDLGGLLLANLDARGALSSLQRVTEDTVPWFPGQYALVTTDTLLVQHQYACRDPSALIETGRLPSWPNDQGAALLLNKQGRLLDQLHYDAKWHFALLADPEGVSLERIFADAPTQDTNNWHSASTQSGYGTPGYLNSAARISTISAVAVRLSPRVVSPDGDGYDDFAIIDYQFPEAGYMCSISIFDAGGILVRKLVQTALCGTTGQFVWDGLNDQHATLPMGIYIVNTQIFNLQGKTKKYKHIITLARKQ